VRLVRLLGSDGARGLYNARLTRDAPAITAEARGASDGNETGGGGSLEGDPRAARFDWGDVWEMHSADKPVMKSFWLDKNAGHGDRNDGDRNDGGERLSAQAVHDPRLFKVQKGRLGSSLLCVGFWLCPF